MISLIFPGLDNSVPFYKQTRFSAKIVSPKPQDVGLKALSLGGVGQTADAVTRSLPASLNVTVRLTRQDYTPLRTETKVLRIEDRNGDDSKPPGTFGLSPYSRPR